MEVEQAALGAVLDGIGAEGARVHLGDGVADGGQAVALAPAVRQEQALVLAREGRPDPVLQQARAADDERLVADVVQRHGEALHDLLGQLRVLERLDNVRILLPDLLDLEVLAVVDVLQVVVVEEGQQPVRRDVPRLRHLERPDRVGVLLRAAHDVIGEQEARALAAQLAARARRRDDVLHDAAEVVDVEVVLGGVDVLEVVGEEPAHQRHAQADLHRSRELPVAEAHPLEALEGVGDLGERGALVFDRLDQVPALVVLHPLLDDVDDLVVGEVVGGDAEGRVRHAHQRVGAGPLDGAVVVAHFPFPLVRAEVLQQALGLVDAAPDEVVDHPPGHAREQVRIGAAQELDDDAPVAALVAGRLLDGVLPVPRHAAQAAPGEELAQRQADVIDQPALLLDERALVGLREVGLVEHLDGADGLAHHDDRCAQDPGRLGALGGLVDGGLDGDLGPARVRVLPPGRDDLDQLPAHLVGGPIGIGRHVLHLVKAGQFLRPLAEAIHEVERAVAMGGHGYRLLGARG